MRNPLTRAIEAKFTTLEPLLDERARRLGAAVEARALGRGGIIRVAEATGLSRGTIRAGWRELDTPVPPNGGRPPTGRLRRPGGGRKLLVDHDPDLLRDLEALVDPVTRGDPMSPLRWTCKSAAKLAEGLRSRGHPVSERTVNRLLHALGYSLQGNRKTIEGKDHPDRDAQFQYYQPAGQGLPAAGAAGGLGRYQEEGVGGPLSQWWPGVAAQGATRGGEGPRLQRQGVGQGHPLRRLRPGGGHRLGERGGGSRYGGVRRGELAAVVAADGQPGLPPGEEAAAHGRRGGLQRDSLPAVEGGVAATG